MNLRSQLLLKHSRQNMQAISEYIGSDKRRMSQLMALLFSAEYAVQQRASWAVTYCADRQPQLISPYLEKMVHLLGQPVHDAVKRNVTRILRDIAIPDPLTGQVTDHCFRLLAEPATSTAIKVFCMYILVKMVKSEPELGRELRLVIAENLPYASKGVRLAAEKSLQALDRLPASSGRNRPA